MLTHPVPSGLSEAGSALWSLIAAKYELRADELSTLEDACREADMIRQMESYRSADDFEMMVRGSQGQKVINPIISELRQHAMAKKSLLASLRLPDESGSSDQGGELSAKNRAAANARWSNRGA